MKRVLLLAALCMAAVLAFAPAVVAQEDPCPDPDFPRYTPDGCQASDLPDVAVPGVAPSSPEPESVSAEATASASASVPAEEVSCEGFTTISGEPSQFQAQQFFDFSATEEEQAILDPDGNGFACDDGEIEFGGDDSSVTASASAASVEALPETGGPSPAAFALSSLALLVAGGIFAARLVRR